MAGVTVVAGAGDGGDEGVDDTETRDRRRHASKGRVKAEYNIAVMIVLAVETVSREGSVALWRDGTCYAHRGQPSRTHAERLPGELLSLLDCHNLTLADVDVFAVVTGPGSFTGLRVGVATVQGLALAGHRQVVGIPTLEALVTTWRLECDEDAQVVACLDGPRGDVFVAAFDIAAGRPIDECPTLLAPGAAIPQEAVEWMDATVSRDRRLVLVGSGAMRYVDIFRDRFPAAEIVDAPRPLAEAAAVLAAGRVTQAGTPHALRPVYLRRADVAMPRERSARAPSPHPAADVYVIGRASTAADFDAVEILQRKTFTNPWGAEAIRWELEHTDVARLYLLHEPAGEAVAYCACWVIFDELHINSLAVDPAWRRRGMARRLLRHVMAEAVADGAASATLEVRASNEAARKLYEGLGFRVEGVRREYYRDPREDALILWNRSLNARPARPAGMT